MKNKRIIKVLLTIGLSVVLALPQPGYLLYAAEVHDDIDIAPEEAVVEETVTEYGDDLSEDNVPEEIVDQDEFQSEYRVEDVYWYENKTDGKKERSSESTYDMSEATEWCNTFVCSPFNFEDYGLDKMTVYNNYLTATSSDESVIKVIGVNTNDGVYKEPEDMIFTFRLVGPGTATITIGSKDGAHKITNKVTVIGETQPEEQGYVPEDLYWGINNKKKLYNISSVSNFSNVLTQYRYYRTLYCTPFNYSDYGLDKKSVYEKYFIATSSDESVIKVYGVNTNGKPSGDGTDNSLAFEYEYVGPGTATVNVRSKDGRLSINWTVTLTDDTQPTDSATAIWAITGKGDTDDYMERTVDVSKGNVTQDFTVGIQIKPQDAKYSIEWDISDPAVVSTGPQTAGWIEDYKNTYPNSEWYSIKTKKVGVSVVTFNIHLGSKTVSKKVKLRVIDPDVVEAKKVGWAFCNWKTDAIVTNYEGSTEYQNGTYDGIRLDPVNADANITYTISNPDILTVKQKTGDFYPGYSPTEYPGTKWYDFDYKGFGQSVVTFYVTSGNKQWTLTKTFRLLGKVDESTSTVRAQIVRGQKFDVWDTVIGAGTGIIESDKDDKTFSFTVDNSKIATISKGVMTGKSEGDVNIGYTRKIGGKTVTGRTGVAVKVHNPQVTAKSITLTYMGQTANASDIITCPVAPTRYVSSKPEVAMVNSTTGLITATGKGTTKITAEFGEGKNAAKFTFNVKVNVPYMSKAQVTVLTGTNGMNITLKGVEKDKLSQITWNDGILGGGVVATADPKKKEICHVAPGIGAADTTLSAVCDGITYSCRVVVPAPKLKPIDAGNPDDMSLTLSPKKSKQLALDPKTTKLKTKDLLWTTSNSAAVTVNNGKITAVSAGSAQIKASYKGMTIATINVTVQ
ncbi:MAG: Ig-like domain-containing protein [Lachnospiraceae bacterium]|nr:Ig-like domain-containing protein [Lachnospiraceae bacterium]